MIEMIPSIVLLLIFCGFAVYNQRRRFRQKILLQRGIKICGEVRFVHKEWTGKNKYYELYAEFEYDRKTYYALQRSLNKPSFKAGDPVGICFDPDDPDKNMILDFSDSRIEI